METNPGHRYKVEATRLVGSSMYHQDSMRKEFSFGKGKKFATGKLAKVAAEEFANSIMDQANRVSIWKMNGHGGQSVMLKNDEEQRFMTDWPKQ